MAHAAAISIGANLGDRDANIQNALAALRALDGVQSVRASGAIETDAVIPPGGDGQPMYLNAAALLETTLSPRALLDALLDIERSLGRDRGSEGRWGARTLDLDLLLYDDLCLDDPGLTVPHPRLHERRFALEPLARIAPELVHPGLGLSVQAMLDRLPHSDVKAPS